MSDAALRAITLPGDLEAVLALEDAAAAAANAFVYDDAAQSRAVRAELLARGAAEWAPPFGRVLAAPGEAPTGLLAVLTADDLSRRRLGAALALRRAGIPLPPAVVERMRLASASLVRCEPGDAYLSRIAVDPAAAGRGLGSRLLADAVAQARSAGARRLLLDVDAANTRAIALYERARFAHVGALEVEHPPSGRRLQHLHLALPLS